MAKKLVIVESPAKAKTIGNYLGSDYEVLASIGHVRDLLPNGKNLPSELKKKWWADYAVDVDNGFEPIYEVPESKTAQIRKLKDALKSKDTLVLATDEDREGESISWHLKEVLNPPKSTKVIRIAFHEITKDAIQYAINHPRDLDENLVHAQETRRVLDRLYGYTLSPILWSRIERNLSAGRVQTPAVKLIVEREKARLRFVAAEYWDLKALLVKEKSEFFAYLKKIDQSTIANGNDFDDETGELKKSKEAKLVLGGEEAQYLAQKASGFTPWKVTSIEEKEGTENPMPPFMTTTLQQDANRKFGFSADRTMKVAQSLYEGIDIGGETVGLITYMRTDSLTLSKSALENIRETIKAFYPDCLPEKPREFANKVRNAQEAHEAIRVTDASRRPSDIRSKLSEDQFKIYDLIWKRTVACQMKAARVLRTEATFEVPVDDKILTFVSTGKQILFEGFLKVYQVGRDEVAEDRDDDRRLPRLQKSDVVICNGVTGEKHETLPPSRYTEATLIKKLEENGIGRPSTYATIMSVIVDRGYVRRVGKSLVPTFTAFLTMDLLDTNFQEFTKIEFTRNLDDVLDEIALGKKDSTHYLGDFFLGENGLKTVVDLRKRDLPYPSFIVGLHPETNEEIMVRINREGQPFLQLGPRENKNYANVPETLAPGDLTVTKAIELLQTKDAGTESIGIDPVTGRQLLLKNRNGYYLETQRTDEEIARKDKPRWISVPSGIDPRTLSPEQIEFLCTLPRKIGVDTESKKGIEFKIGKFGAYLECGTERRTIANWEDGQTMTLEQAQHILASPKTGFVRRAAQALKEFPATEEGKAPIRVLSGRFGPYVTDGETNATLPKSTNPIEITLDDALDLLKKKREAGPATARSTRPVKRKATSSTRAKRPVTGSKAKKEAKKVR